MYVHTMCYNATASIISFTTGIISSVVLCLYNPILGLFFAWVTCMQLFDWIFWNNQKRTRLNFVITKIATFFNISQPIILAALIVLFQKEPLKPFSQGVLLLYVFVSVIYIATSWHKVDYTLVDPISYPGLFWKWNHMPGNFIIYSLYLVLLSALIVQHFKYPIMQIFLLVTWVSFIVSIAHLKKKALGRFWCYFAAYIPLLLSVMYLSRINCGHLNF